MEDFFYAGGLRALMKQIEERLDTSAITVTGKTLGETLRGAKVYNEDVIRPLSNPFYHEGSLAVLRGNLAPSDAVIKPAACDPKYHVHEGPALVFDSYPEMKAAIGWGYMFQNHVGQADEGCDFDFLTRAKGRAAGEPSIY